ncbi:AAA family ATPase [Kordia sp. TARA_039_SRF]|nr:AAA family ATPase [Kordia sp. TARA_039_SRF]
MERALKLKVSKELKYLVEIHGTKTISKKADIAPSTLESMLKESTKLVPNEIWEQTRLNLRMQLDWKVVEDSNLKRTVELLKAVQKNNMSIGICERAGAGKTETYKYYEREFVNVINVECGSQWTRKEFLKKMLRCAGLSPVGNSNRMMEKFIRHVRQMKKPLIIIDQADKLKDHALDLYIDMYNALSGKAGFVLSGADGFKKRIERGLKYGKVGFAELYSRLGQKFIQFGALTLEDVKLMCKANGMDDELTIAETFNKCGGDKRVVRRQIEKYILIKEKAA